MNLNNATADGVDESVLELLGELSNEYPQADEKELLLVLSHYLAENGSTDGLAENGAAEILADLDGAVPGSAVDDGGAGSGGGPRSAVGKERDALAEKAMNVTDWERAERNGQRPAEYLSDRYGVDVDPARHDERDLLETVRTKRQDGGR